jgi:chromosome partitioning protein
MADQVQFVVWLVAMLKGGVRKTTTTMFVAFELASRGYEVLVIDADAGSQGVTDWATQVYAEQHELPFHVVQWTPAMGLIVPFIQSKQREVGAAIVLVDLGGEQPDVLRQLMMIADLLISPGGPERGELGRLPATVAVSAGTEVPHRVLLTRVAVAGRGAALQARADATKMGATVLRTEIEHNRTRYADVWGTVLTSTATYKKLVDELLGADDEDQEHAEQEVGTA